jgi:uncharacterized protein YehS (DUF1456 family)
MYNNTVLRSLRYTFDFSDDKMIEIYGLAGLIVSRAEVCDWLKPETETDYKAIYDQQLAAFLNGMIILNRGMKDDKLPAIEKKINNNMVFRKIKIALSLKDNDILDILKLADFKFSKHELSAIFRNPEQSQYKACKDQLLRNFLHGLVLKYRPA